MLLVGLDVLVVGFTANEAPVVIVSRGSNHRFAIDLLDIVDGSCRVRSVLILRCVANQPFLVVECHIRRRYSVTLIVD